MCSEYIHGLCLCVSVYLLSVSLISISPYLHVSTTKRFSVLCFPHLAPLLMKYQSLSYSYEEKMNETVTRPLLQTPSALTTSLLHRLQGESHQSREGLRAQLQLLSALLPSASLSGIRDFFAVRNFSSGTYILVFSGSLMKSTVISCRSHWGRTVGFHPRLEVCVWSWGGQWSDQEDPGSCGS